MSESATYEYALQEPAMATAPVFLVIAKNSRKKLDVTFEFRDAIFQWRGPDALGMLEQSVLLVLMCAAKQQPYRLTPSSCTREAILLRTALASDPEVDIPLIVVKMTWHGLVSAMGYKSYGGGYRRLVQLAVERLAETTIWVTRDGRKYQSRVLSWLASDEDGVTVLLNKHATDTLSGGQFIKISLSERTSLSDERSKALHAWLSSNIRQCSSRVYNISVLQKHVWGGESTGSKLRSRLCRLRSALRGIDALPAWKCEFINKDRISVSRIFPGINSNKTMHNQRPVGIFSDGAKMVEMQAKPAENSSEL